MGEKKHTSWTSFTSGITLMSTLAILYAILVFIPALIYLTLMTGGIGGIPVAWFTLLLWVELSRLSGRRVTKQEASMIFILTGAEMFYPLSLVYTAWYRASPIAELFDIGRYVPDWAAPAKETGILELRTFFHPAWVLPIAVSLIASIFFGLLTFGLGLVAREAFIETERLPFPIQQMNASALTVLTGEEKRPVWILAVTGVIGFLYGFVLYAAPFIGQALTKKYVQLIPIPWVDLNLNVEKYFPGASFGVATDLAPIASGFILTFPVVLGIFIGSFAVWFFGNWIVNINWVAWGLPDAEPDLAGVQSWWLPGMSIRMAWQRSILYFWATISIGILLAVGLAPMLHHPRFLGRMFSTLFKPKVKRRTTDPLSFTKVVLPLLAVGTAGGLMLFTVLVPNFVQQNLWIIPLMIIMPLITTFIGGRMIGETGRGIGAFADPLRNILYLASGYKGVDIWFAPNVMTTGGFGKLSWFKIGELTETKSDSYIKMYYLLLPLAIFVGYLYVEIFWRIAPIPSGRYPGVAIFWDVSATMQTLWIRGMTGGLFPPLRILYAFIAGTGIYFALALLHSPLSFVVIGAGASTITPIAMTILIGGLVAQVLRRIMGKDWWNKHRLLLAAGLMLGEGLAVTVSVAVALVVNSIWILPY